MDLGDLLFKVSERGKVLSQSSVGDDMARRLLEREVEVALLAHRLHGRLPLGHFLRRLLILET